MIDDHEIFIPFGPRLFNPPDLEDIAAALETDSYELENCVLQNLCDEGGAELQMVEIKEGKLICHWSESVYSGCEDFELHNNCSVVLSTRIEDEGIYVFVNPGTVYNIQHWLGGPDEE
jgi:hypothetical protein